MRKPHLRKVKGKWRIWRHRSVCSWAFPTVIREDLKECFIAHMKYIGK